MNSPSTASTSCSSTQSFKAKYKTEMCRNWELTGVCKFGDNCAFAHGDEELQKKKHVPSKYKTRLCKQYHENLYCPYGLRCQFVHTTRSFQEGDIKNVSYIQILEENANQVLHRMLHSENQDLMEFNSVCKDLPRLKVFEQIMAPSVQTASSDSNQDKKDIPHSVAQKVKRTLFESTMDEYHQMRSVRMEQRAD